MNRCSTNKEKTAAYFGRSFKDKTLLGKGLVIPFTELKIVKKLMEVPCG